MLGLALLWACDPPPEPSIPSSDGPRPLIGADAELTRVSWAVDDGDRIYVAQPMESVVRVFDVDGRARGTLGRAGEGPGEFRGVRNLGLVGDSLWVYDFRLARLSWFHDGEFVGSTAAPVAQELVPVTGTTYLSWGTLMGPVRGWTVRVMDEAGGALADLGSYRGGDQMVIDFGGVEFVSFQPFGVDPRFAVLDGRPWIAEDRIPLGADDTSLVLVTFDQAGNRIERSVEMPPQRLTAERREQEVGRWVENSRASERRGLVQLGPDVDVRRAVEEALAVPAFLPLASALFGGCGHLTLVRGLEDGSQEWVQLAAGGNVTSRKTVPGTWEPVGVGCGAVLVVTRNAHDVPTLHRVAWD